MKTNQLVLAVTALFSAGLTMPAAAQVHERAKRLFEFGGASGYDPLAGVIADADGTVLGTAAVGGSGTCSGGTGCGTVFALLPPVHGNGWTYNAIYNFQGGQDGGFPRAPLSLDGTGTVYGYSAYASPGAVFQLMPPATNGGAWTFQVIYAFTGQADGNLENVYSPLIFQNGDLYGIASGNGSVKCGQFGCGSVFRLTPGSGGTWTEETLYNFTGDEDGGNPTWIAGFDSGGALYVSTALGNGAVVKLSPAAPGSSWAATVITRFKGGGHLNFPTNLILASNGTLYGIASRRRGGVVFQLTPPTDGGSKWARTTLAIVSDHRYGPVSLTLEAGGDLVGTIQGDVDFFPGSVFQLSPPESGGTWTYTRLWNFDRGPDRNPLNVVAGRGGHLFGVLNGGDSGSGSLFELR